MYGRKYMGIARVTYLIDAAGTVARRWDAVKVEDACRRGARGRERAGGQVSRVASARALGSGSELATAAPRGRWHVALAACPRPGPGAVRPGGGRPRAQGEDHRAGRRSDPRHQQGRRRVAGRSGRGAVRRVDRAGRRGAYLDRVAPRAGRGDRRAATRRAQGDDRARDVPCRGAHGAVRSVAARRHRRGRAVARVGLVRLLGLSRGATTATCSCSPSSTGCRSAA